MITLILACLLVLVAVITLSMQKTYSHLPLKELKRRAQKGDEEAATLYKAATYDNSLHIFLWGIIGLSSAGFMLIVARTVSGWLALLLILAFLIISFVWLPRHHPGRLNIKITKLLAPLVARLLEYIHPLVSRLDGLIGLNDQAQKYSNLYEKKDLLELLSAQKTMSHNRIPTSELDFATHALNFGNKIVRDFMTPLSKKRLPEAKEPIGPILIDELHKTGSAHFAVVDALEGKVVGSLFIGDLMKHSKSGTVSDVMSSKVYYIHEDQSLEDALYAFRTTKYPLFAVVNSFEETVGIIDIDDILQQILGQMTSPNFDQYDDLAAVAAWKPIKENEVDPKLPEESPEKINQPPKPNQANITQEDIDETIEIE